MRRKPRCLKLMTPAILPVIIASQTTDKIIPVMVGTSHDMMFVGTLRHCRYLGPGCTTRPAARQSRESAQNECSWCELALDTLCGIPRQRYQVRICERRVGEREDGEERPKASCGTLPAADDTTSTSTKRSLHECRSIVSGANL